MPVDHDGVDDQPEDPERDNGQWEGDDFRKRPRVAFTKPITTAAINAARGPLTEKPGTTRETIQIAKALSTQ